TSSMCVDTDVGDRLNLVGIMLLNNERRDTLKTVNEIGGAVSGIVERHNAEVLVLLARFVVTHDVAVAVRKNYVPVARIGNDETALAAAGRIPIARFDDAGVGATRDAD